MKRLTPFGWAVAALAITITTLLGRAAYTSRAWDYSCRLFLLVLGNDR